MANATIVIVNSTGTYTAPYTPSTRIVGTTSSIAGISSIRQSVLAQTTTFVGSVKSIGRPSSSESSSEDTYSSRYGTAGSSCSISSNILTIEGFLATPKSVNVSANTFSSTISCTIYNQKVLLSSSSVFRSNIQATINRSSSITCSVSVLNSSTSNLIVYSPSVNVNVSSLGSSSLCNIYISDLLVDATYIDSEFPAINGNLYIVLNLKTKSHVNWTDGDNIAIARTGGLSFGSTSMQNVSDAYPLSRGVNDIDLIVDSDEETRRTYGSSFGDAGQAKIKNKKIPLSKGLKGTKWKFALYTPAASSLDVRSVDLLVNELDRRV